jgi:peptidoglycan L-alanyl-D-glutamate endopeptidase CwlK
MALSQRDLLRLTGVHPDLVRVVLGAAVLAPRTFIVTEGLRTVERERELIAQGKSSLTDPYRCRHVTGHAVDVCIIIEGKACWDFSEYQGLAFAMKGVALDLKVPLEWGGNWKSFQDAPHFQLPWSQYPSPNPRRAP